MAKPYRLVIGDNTGIPRQAQAGDGLVGNFIKDTALTTVGAGTLLAATMLTGFVLRTGPAGAFADTLDTGANMDAAFPGAVVGDTVDFYYSNNVAFAGTITAAAGSVLNTAAANNVVAANTGRLIHGEKTGVGTWEFYVI